MNIVSVLDSIFLPFLIAGILGWGLLFYREKQERRKIALAVAICALFMLGWRCFIPHFSSGRYGENLFAFFVFGSAFVASYWPWAGEKYSWWRKGRSAFFALQVLLIVIGFVALGLKFFRYNPYRNYVNLVTEAICQDIQGDSNAIICIDLQYFYFCGIPQIFLPEGLSKDLAPEDYIQGAIRHYQYMYDRLYFPCDLPPEKVKLLAGEEKNWTTVGAYQKNRKGKKIYVYRYASRPFSGQLEPVERPDPLAADSLLKNGGFEKMRSAEYAERIDQSDKKGFIPDGAQFPENWTILWAYGFEDGCNASVYATKQDVVAGEKSLLMQGEKSISVLYATMLPGGDYEFQCNFRSNEGKARVGIMLSLRDQDGVFYGFRELKSEVLMESGQLYRYKAEITKDMFYPYENFYLYIVLYDGGAVLLDNVVLRARTN